MPTLVLVRHGQSLWNLENRFTGWWDVDLSPTGEEEARQAGRLLADEGMLPDVAHTSLLTRAIRTLNILQEETARLWIPVHRHWRLNERHYGGLTGLDKAETARPLRRRAVPAVAAELRRAAAAVGAGFRLRRVDRRPLRARASSPARSAWPTSWCAWSLTGTTLSRPPCSPARWCWWRPTATACGRSSSTSTR